MNGEVKFSHQMLCQQTMKSEKWQTGREKKNYWFPCATQPPSGKLFRNFKDFEGMLKKTISSTY